MRGGALRDQIRIESRTQTGTDTLNTPIYGWSTWREPYAEVTTRRGQEHFDQDNKQRYSETLYRFRCRYDDVVGVNTTMRIVFEGQVFDIKNALPDLRRREDFLIEASLQSD